MIIKNVTVVEFDPVRERKAMASWVMGNDMSEWELRESSTSYIYTKTESYYIDAKRKAESDGSISR